MDEVVVDTLIFKNNLYGSTNYRGHQVPLRHDSYLDAQNPCKPSLGF